MVETRTTVLISLLTSATVSAAVTLGLGASGLGASSLAVRSPAAPDPASWRCDDATADCPDQAELDGRVRALQRQISALEEDQSRAHRATIPPPETPDEQRVGEAVASALQDERALTLSRRISTKQELDLALLDEFRSEVEVTDAVAEAVKDAYLDATARHLTLIADAEDGTIPWEEARAAMQESWQTGREEVGAALTDPEFAALVELAKKHSTVLFLEVTEPAEGETPLQ